MAEILLDVDGYTFADLTPGNYVFGTAPLIGIPALFNDPPFIHVRNNNDGEHFITNLTRVGFTLMDKGEGSAPSVTITIIKP